MLKFIPGLLGFVCLVVAAYVLFGLGWSLAVMGVLCLLVDRRMS